MDGWIAQDGNIDYNRQPQTRANTNNHGEGADGQRVPGTRCRSRPRGDADREARRARDWQATGKAQGQAREDAVGYVGRAGPDRLRAWSSRISSGGVAAGRLCAASAVHPRTARSPHLCSPSNAHAPPPTHAARLQPTLAPEPLPATHSAACPSRAALHHCSPCAAFRAARHCCWLWLWSGGDAARLPSPATPCSNAAALLCSADGRPLWCCVLRCSACCCHLLELCHRPAQVRTLVAAAGPAQSASPPACQPLTAAFPQLLLLCIVVVAPAVSCQRPLKPPACP